MTTLSLQNKDLPGRLTLLAGSGDLPAEVLAAAKKAGWVIQLLGLEKNHAVDGEAAPYVDLRNPLPAVLKVRKFGATHLCFAGGIKISDSGREGLFKHFGKGRKKQRSGGDSALARLGGAVELATGAKLIGAHEIAPELLVADGHLAGPVIAKRDLDNLDFALKTAKRAGELDLGQAAISCGHRVVGLEDIGGTDELMKRVGGYIAEGLTGDGADPVVMAKVCKPGQPHYVDLPSIGPNTLVQAAAAGIKAIVLEAELALIIRRTETLERAEELGISLYGRTVADA